MFVLSFSSDEGSVLTQRQALEDILRGSDELNRYGHDKAANHFNGEQIPQGKYSTLSILAYS